MKKPVVNMDSVFASSDRRHHADAHLSHNTPPSKRYFHPEITAPEISSAQDSSWEKIRQHPLLHRSNLRQTPTTEHTSNSKAAAVRKFAYTTLGGVRYKSRRSRGYMVWEPQAEWARPISLSKEGNGIEEFEYTPTRPSRRKSFSDLVGTLSRKSGWRGFRQPVTPTKKSDIYHITPIYPRKADYGEYHQAKQHITIVDRRLDDSFRRTQKHSAHWRKSHPKPSTDDDASSTIFEDDTSLGKGEACVSSLSQIQECFDPIFYFLPWHSRSILYEELYEQTGQRIPDGETDYLHDFYPEFPNRSEVLQEQYMEAVKQSDAQSIQQDIKLMVQNMTKNQTASTAGTEGEDLNSMYRRFEINEEDFWDSVKTGTDVTRENKFEPKLKRILSCDLDKVSWVDKILQETNRLRRPTQKLVSSIAGIEETLEDSVEFRTPKEKCNEFCSHLDEDDPENPKLPSAPPPTRSNSPVNIRETLANNKEITPPSLWSIKQNRNLRKSISSTESYFPSLWAPDQVYTRCPTTPIHEKDSDHIDQSEISYDSGSSSDGPLEDDPASGNIVNSHDQNVTRRGSTEKEWCILPDLKPDNSLPLPTWVDLGKIWRRRRNQNTINFENVPLDECEVRYDVSNASDASGEFEGTEDIIGRREIHLSTFLDHMLGIGEKFADSLVSWQDLMKLAERKNRSAVLSPQAMPAIEAQLTPKVVLSIHRRASGQSHNSGDTGYTPMPDIDHCTVFKVTKFGCHLPPVHGQAIVRNMESHEALKDMENLAMSSDEPCQPPEKLFTHLAAEGTSMPGVTAGKVGHLINIFQAHGIIPDPKPNLARTRSPLQSTPGKRIFCMASSENSSSSNHPLTVQNDRPFSRLSNQDTESSSTFGEELERVEHVPFKAAEQ